MLLKVFYCAYFWFRKGSDFESSGSGSNNTKLSELGRALILNRRVWAGSDSNDTAFFELTRAPISIWRIRMDSALMTQNVSNLSGL